MSEPIENKLDTEKLNLNNSQESDIDTCKADIVDANTLIDLPTAITTVIARTEATNITVSIVNAFLEILQSKSPTVFTNEDINKIQSTVNIETEKTDALFKQIEKILSEQRKGSKKISNRSW